MSPDWNPRVDPPALEGFLPNLVPGRSFVEDLAAAEHQPRLVFLRLDLDFGREAHAEELRADLLAELGFGQEQKVVGASTQHPKRCNHASLRRQQQRVAHVPCASAWTS